MADPAIFDSRQDMQFFVEQVAHEVLVQTEAEGDDVERIAGCCGPAFEPTTDRLGRHRSGPLRSQRCIRWFSVGSTPLSQGTSLAVAPSVRAYTVNLPSVSQISHSFEPIRC